MIRPRHIARRIAAAERAQHIMPIEKWSERITVARVTGESHLTDDFQTLFEQVGAREQDVVLDLAGIRYVNSSHIARLLKLRKQMITHNCRLLLCGVDPQVWGTFLVTGLDKVFEFSDSVPTALATLQLGASGASASG
jgi:anti-anti-sigma factor